MICSSSETGAEANPSESEGYLSDLVTILLKRVVVRRVESKVRIQDSRISFPVSSKQRSKIKVVQSFPRSRQIVVENLHDLLEIAVFPARAREQPLGGLEINRS
jgi:hypothetical protein